MLEWFTKKENINVDEESTKVSKILSQRLAIEEQSQFVKGVIDYLIILRKSEIEDLEKKLSIAKESLNNLNGFL